MTVRGRETPRALLDAWALAIGQPDPLIALAATRAVRAHLSEWESRLATEAIADGHTWDAIGQAIGISRQAAWDRFHDEVSGGRRSYEREVTRLRSEVERLRRRAQLPGRPDA